MIKVQIHFLKPICSIALPVCQEPRTMNLCRISARIGTRLFLFIWNSSNAVPGDCVICIPRGGKESQGRWSKVLMVLQMECKETGYLVKFEKLQFTHQIVSSCCFNEIDISLNQHYASSPLSQCVHLQSPRLAIVNLRVPILLKILGNKYV
jgi:hypothetical protein